MNKLFQYTSFAVACIIIFSSTLIFLVPISDAEPIPPNNKLWERLLAYFLKMIWFNIGSGPTPKYFYADPTIVEIDYLDNATINLTWGTNESDRRPYHRFQEIVFKEFRIVYEAIFPDEIQENAFNVVFDPPVFDVLEYHEEVGGTEAEAQQPTTKMHLSLDMPIDPGNPIQDFILKINVSIYRKYGNLLEVFGIIPVIWGGFLNAQYLSDIGHKSFEVFIKVKPFHYADLYVSDPIRMHLNDIKSAQIRVHNRGSNIEQFGFRVNGGGDSLFVNTPPPISLYPGEMGIVDVGLISKPILYDRGTLHSIEVEVFPHDNPDVTLASGILSVRTQGFAIQGIFSYEYSLHIFIIILVVLILIIFWIFIRRFNLARVCQKPRKPWTNPKEKEYLEKLLKGKKREKYQETLQMMKDEYSSSLLWYYYYRKYLIVKNRKKINWKKLNEKFSSIFSNISNRIEKKQLEKPEVKEEKLIKVERTIERKIDVKRERTLRKIKKQEEKQKKKLRN